MEEIIYGPAGQQYSRLAMEDDTAEKEAQNEVNFDNASGFGSGELSLTSESEGTGAVYQGIVYHVGVNALGHQFCHRRYLRIRGKYVEMYKKNPQTGAKPIRQGVVGQFLKVEDLGRRKIYGADLYVFKVYNALDDTKKGEIACMTASDAHYWRNAFQQAKDEFQAEYSSKGSGHKILDDTDEFELGGHRSRLRRYALGLTKLITIGRGTESFFGRVAKSSHNSSSEIYAQKQEDDTIDEHDWRCVRSVNGIRILEDVSCTAEKLVIMKSVGVVEASPSSIFEMLIDLKSPHRKEWDILAGDLKLVESVNGHCDVVYGTFDPKYLNRWNSKRDFVFSRVWRHDPDNTYSIFQSSTTHKQCPKKPGFRRIKLNSSTWEIKPLPFQKSDNARSVVTQITEIRSTGWGRWKKKYYAKLDETMPYVVLCQVAGLRDYFASHPVQEADITTAPIAKGMKVLGSPLEENAISVVKEEFYDAIAAEIPEEEEQDDSDEDEEKPKKVTSHRFKSIAWSLMGLTPHAKAVAGELVSECEPVEMKLDAFKGSLYEASSDSNCWTDPGGKGFMVRGKTYVRDNLKVPGGDPLLKLLAVDWFTSPKKINRVATNPNCLIQSEAGRQLPFILIMNLQVPATPNYSLVFYFAADRPIRKGSLLDRFANGDDTFRDSRFKLIPRIVEGYWFVKRAVGTKACLLGKAVTCNYLRQDNFLEIDVDIGSSSIARSIINLVLGQITSLVVDMAVLIEGRGERELPEYLLGTTRINRVRLESAVPYPEK